MSRLAILTMFVLAACAPTIDPAARASLDQWNAGIQNQAQTYDDPGAARSAPKVGQWAEYRTVQPDGTLTRDVVKVVGEDNGAYWIENEISGYDGTTVMKALVAMSDWNDPQSIDIRRILRQGPDGQVEELPAIVINSVAGSFISTLGPAASVQSDGPVETVTVPAGRFAARRIETSGISLPLLGSTAATYWANVMVPVWNTVLIEHADGGRMELVDFGDSGATSAIPDTASQL